MKRDQKKHQKQKKREQKLAEREKHSQRIEQERLRRDQYPEIVLDTANGEPEFVDLVLKALGEMDFDDPQNFDEWERGIYRVIRQHGIEYAMQCLKEAMRQKVEAGDPQAHLGEMMFVLGFGHRLLERIPEDARRRLMPYNDVRIRYSGQKMLLQFSSMQTTKGSGGTIFSARRRPSIELNGQQWVVAFSRHAIERICERLNPRYLTYAAAGDIHAFFSSCVYFEPIMLYGNQPAFALYDLCDNPEFIQYDTYVRNILGKENVDPAQGKCYYRVGYCPIVFDGEFAKAKTFLYPGYTATPEYGLVLRAKLSRSEREILIQQATTQDATEVVVNDNPSVIKWFHEHGVPQVVQMKQDVFRYDV